MCLTVILSLCWIRILPWVGSLWGRVFVYWTKALQLEGSVVMAPQQWGARIHFALPYLNASAGPPDPHTWWITAVVTVLVSADLRTVRLGRTFPLVTVPFRSLFLPAKAVFMNLLSVSATYGVLVLVFQDHWGKVLGLQHSPHVIGRSNAPTDLHL